MTKTKPMFGAGLWHPTSDYARAHFMRLDSTPGNFHFACALDTIFIGDRSSARGRKAEHCAACTEAIAPPGGPTP